MAARGMRRGLLSVVTAARPHQWVKNLLLVVPVLAAHRFEWQVPQNLVLAFASLSLCASGGYILNDLLDVKSDRQHPRKRQRPFAAGDLSLRTGFLLLGAAWFLGLGSAAVFLPAAFVITAFVYVLATSAYSMRLKREPVLDVMVLSGLYVTRVIAGGTATGVLVSTWLLAFTLFVCLSLAFLKRFIEVKAQPGASTTAVPGRGYFTDDAGWLQAVGTSSAYLSVVVLAIYANSSDVTRLYAHPERLLMVCPVLLYWTTRVWLQAHRRRIHDDPVIAVTADPVTYVVAAISAVIVLAAV